MPIYEYRCQSCEKTFEFMQRMSEAPKSSCEECGGALERLISQSAFHLKGGGWYKDLYSSTKKDSGSGEGASAEGGGAKESKSDSSSGDKAGAAKATGDSTKSSSGGAGSGASGSGASGSGASGASKSGTTTTKPK